MAPGDDETAVGAVPQGHEIAFGRYRLLEVVGQGAMGVVWRAWDPELARHVAIKRVHPGLGAAARDRILAEGQALGALSHPSIVPIYDVGVAGDQVYLVMEWIQGTTLRAYAASCARRDLLEAYRQAGEGLAAAHREGLVHRDFKPDNAIRGDDGRVRVVDFGLARSVDTPELARQSAGAGTIAPEQASGGAVTAAADQYAFAASLREALTRPIDGQPAELPGWLAAIVARGTATDPTDRFASMDDLLRALARDPARRWRRRAIVAGAALAAAAVAFVVGRSQPPAAPSCVGSTAEIARTWNLASRAQAVAHLRTLDAFAASEADRLGEELDHYSAAWADEHRRACVARERGELSATQHERRVACLARGRAALGAVAELMVSVPRNGLPQALIAARSLPSAAACAAGDVAADDGAVAAPPVARAAEVAAVAPAVERARVLAVAASANAIAVARASVIDAERTGHAPLIARALIAQGSAEVALGGGEAAARAPLERAVDLALRSGSDALAVEAYARLVYAVGRYRGDVVANWPVMDAIAQRTGAAGRFSSALLYNNKAVARMGENDRPGARALLQRALAVLPEPLPRDELELVTVYNNLALTTDDPVERERRISQVIALREAALGANHPSTLRSRYFAGTLVRHPAAAEAAFRAACEGYRRWHPQLAADGAQCAFERAWLAADRREPAAALAEMRHAADDPPPRERLLGTIAERYVQIAAGDDVPGAIDALQAGAAVHAQAAGWWTRAEAADAYMVAAIGWERLHRPRDAERCRVAALALFENLHQPYADRRLARVRAVLARRWAQSRPDAARRLAAAALAWYRAAGGYDADVAELGAIAGPEKLARTARR